MTTKTLTPAEFETLKATGAKLKILGNNDFCWDGRDYVHVRYPAGFKPGYGSWGAHSYTYEIIG